MLKITTFREVVLISLLFLKLITVPAIAQDSSDEIWIDVRSPQEYRQGHLQEAINIPFMEIMQQITEVTTDKQANIRLYCTVGSRAQIAKQILDSMGYENVVNKGGLKDIKR